MNRGVGFCVFVVLGGFFPPAIFGGEAARPAADEVRTAAAGIEHFLWSRMADPASGAVFVNAVGDRPVMAGEARNRDALSEAVGQVMELALLRGDRQLFERQLALAKSLFLSESSGFLAWKISPDPFRRADTSATLDDWRVVWACGEAARRWPSREVAGFGEELARRLVAGSAGHFIPPPAFNLGDGSPGSGPVLLCYLHMQAMREFADRIPEIRPLLANSLDVLNGIPSPPGMLPAKWDPSSRKYSDGASDEVLALITLLALRSADPGSARVRDAVDVRARHFREHGSLPQAFDSSSGEALAVPAGASVYALWARLLLACGRVDDAGSAIAKMLEFQNRGPGDFAGAIGGYPVFSFDQLEALLALEDYLAAITAQAADPR